MRKTFSCVTSGIFTFIHNFCLTDIDDWTKLTADLLLFVFFPAVSWSLIQWFPSLIRAHHVGTRVLCPNWLRPSQVPANQQKHGWESHTVRAWAPGLPESPTRWEACCVSFLPCAHRTQTLTDVILLKRTYVVGLMIRCRWQSVTVLSVQAFLREGHPGLFSCLGCEVDQILRRWLGYSWGSARPSSAHFAWRTHTLSNLAMLIWTYIWG